MATRRVSKNLQQGKAGEEATGYRGDNTCQKKSRDMVQPRSRVFLCRSFWGRRSDGVAINEALKIVYILELKRSTDRDDGFLLVKDAEANEQHKSIISALKAAAAAPEWEFVQINLMVGNHGSMVESDFYTKFKKLDISRRNQRQTLRRSCDIGMRSAQSGDFVLPPAGARRYEANYRGIEGEHWAQCARVRR